MRFDHQRLDVYVAAIDFVAVADIIVKSLPRGRAYVADQLQRAAASIALNIAEGAGEYRSKDKARFYRFALRSATECVGLIDVCEKLAICPQEQCEEARQLLDRIVAMLTKLVVRHRPRDHADGTG
jgi:four helix bundle protein